MIFKVCLPKQQEIAFQGILWHVALCALLKACFWKKSISILHRVKSEREMVWKSSGGMELCVVERWQGMDDCDNKEVCEKKLL